MAGQCGQLTSALNRQRAADGIITVLCADAVDRDVKDRLQTQEILALAAGGETVTGPWTATYQIADVYAEESEPKRIDTDFRAKFDSGQFGLDLSDAITPTLIFGDGASQPAYFDPANSEFDGLEFFNGAAENEEWSGQLDLRRDTRFDQNSGHIQAGVNLRSREKSFDATMQAYDGFGPRDLTLAEVQRTVDFGLDEFGPAADPFARRPFFFANRSDFELDAVASAIDSIAEDYTAEEDVMAAYGLVSVDFDRLSLVAGVRVEETQFDATGFEGLDQAVEITLAGDQTGAFTGFIPAPARPGALEVDTVVAEYDAGADETEIEGDRVFSRGVAASQD